jgi:hypothetical protein
MIDPFFRLLWTLFCSIIIALLSMYSRAHAYVPRARIILEKTARHHGRGFYSIQLEVSFRDDRGNQTVTENWIVENGDVMALEARGAGFSYSAVYRGHKKYYLDETGAEKTVKLPADFFEGIFHFRGAESLGSQLTALQMIPSRALAKEKIRSLKDVKYEREPYVRLSRTSGVVNYALGKATPPEAATRDPVVWIEQDQFNIRRLRFPSQAELTADDYNEYGRALYYPKSRTVTWDGKSVTIRTVKVAAIRPTAEQKSRLSASSLRSKKAAPAASGGLNPVIKEFYQRFR